MTTIPYIPAQRGARPASESWRAHAECADLDPRLFFPSASTGWASVIQAATARAVCVACPVRAACLDWAIATGQRSGVWGGRLFGSPERVSGQH
jgi:WhiB family transcriptional regulator, redox-sensing transcriptional regulator